MIYIVNDTQRAFSLICADDAIWMMQDAKQVHICNVDEDVKDVVDEKLSKGIAVNPRRTTKFNVVIPDSVCLYDRTFRNNEYTMFAIHNGAGKESYRYPKSIIFTVSELEDSDKINDVVYDNSSVAAFLDLEFVVNNMGLDIRVYETRYTRWSKYDKVFIPLKDAILELGTIPIQKKDGTKISINALIRCDLKGNRIPRKERKRNKKDGDKKIKKDNDNINNVK